MELLAKHENQIIGLCKKHRVTALFVFGSILGEQFNSESDIDLVARFENVPLEDYADNYFDFCEALEKVFGRKVDVVVESSIKNPFFKEEIEETKQLLFAA